MAFEWKDYIDLGRFLQREASGKTNAEAFLRSAISRAYYGAFCHVRDYAEAKKEAAKSPDAEVRRRAQQLLEQIEPAPVQSVHPHPRIPAAKSYL